jgi:hypothetical protein
VFSDEIDSDDEVVDVNEPADDFVTDVVDTPVQRAPEKTVEQPRAEAEFEEDAPAEVIPPRAEPFLPRRRPEHPDDEMPGDVPGDFAAVTGGMSTVVGSVDGSSAMAAETAPSPFIERDPSVNKSLLLRLIAGVRGL